MSAVSTQCHFQRALWGRKDHPNTFLGDDARCQAPINLIPAGICKSELAENCRAAGKALHKFCAAGAAAVAAAGAAAEVARVAFAVQHGDERRRQRPCGRTPYDASTASLHTVCGFVESTWRGAHRKGSLWSLRV